VIAAAKFALEGVARKVATPVPSPEIPDTGTLVAVSVPLPEAERLAPEPTIIAAEVLVPPVNALNAGLPTEAQVPSPRQKVVDEAPVPLFKFVTPRLPVTPVVKGNPVALVRTTAEGVPRAGVVRVGDVAKTTAPVPVSSVTAAAKFALEGVARNVATPVPSPLIPPSGALVAARVPLPLAPRLAPEPTSIAAVVLVPLVKVLNAGLPPPLDTATPLM
jgi:hypothetical protein